MRKTTITITITDPTQVQTGDKAFFKGCDFGFTVSQVDHEDKIYPFTVMAPFGTDFYWAESATFDHATREVEKPEWPDPHDLDIHVYLGSDGLRYIYNPISQADQVPWAIERQHGFRSRKNLELSNSDALPLTELRLVPAKDDYDE